MAGRDVRMIVECRFRGSSITYESVRFDAIDAFEELRYNSPFTFCTINPFFGRQIIWFRLVHHWRIVLDSAEVVLVPFSLDMRRKKIVVREAFHALGTIRNVLVMNLLTMAFLRNHHSP
jgi:hypothetical protein